MIGLIQTILGFLDNLLTRFIPDPTQREEFKAEVTKTLLANQSSIFESAKDVMVSDTASADTFTSRARPMVVYWSILSITVICGLGFVGLAEPVLETLKQIPESLWNIMAYSIGAYMFARTGEKMVDAVWGGKK
jgi:hypothetical protein